MAKNLRSRMMAKYLSVSGRGDVSRARLGGARACVRFERGKRVAAIYHQVGVGFLQVVGVAQQHHVEHGEVRDLGVRAREHRSRLLVEYTFAAGPAWRGALTSRRLSKRRGLGRGRPAGTSSCKMFSF